MLQADLVYDQPDIPDDWPQHKFVRRRRLDWFGATVMFTYICALGFYIFVRTTKTMDLGVYTWCARCWQVCEALALAHKIWSSGSKLGLHQGVAKSPCLGQLWWQLD